MGAIKGKVLESIKCPRCDSFSSKRITALEKHLIDDHGTTAQETWDALNGGRPTCACGCGGVVRWNGWGKGYSRVVNGHNGSIYSVCSPEEAKAISEKRSSALRGQTSWSKGLTKENDPRVASRAAATSVGRKAAFERGDIESWNRGLTKDIDERVSTAALNLKKAYDDGEITPWARGLTKESDERVAKMAASVSLSLQQKSIRDRLDDLKRLSHTEVQRRIEASGDLEVVDGLGSYINDASKVIVVRCKRCGDSFQGSLRMLGKGRCFKCSPGGSAAQEEIARFIESLGVNVRRNDRRTISLELDIFIPTHGVAVEYNGLYWHCHINKSPNYHSNKTKVAREAGISLIHVFEDEWREKRGIVESIIRAKMGLCTRKIDARKCRVVELSGEEKKKFFTTNHLDGDVRSDAAWGLKLGDEVVYGLSLRHPFHKKHDQSLEVARCCPVVGASVRGGLSRLVSAAKRYCAEREVSSLMTYVDTRLGGSGKGYARAGFNPSGETVPRWWWTDLTDRYNRFKYKADPERKMSEAEVAAEAEVVKIWGCENSIYEMKL